MVNEIRTEVARTDSEQPDPGLLARAGEYIRHGMLVAFPTETVYGLGANALDEAAVERVFVAKQRDRSDPLIVHIASRNDLATVAGPVPPAAEALVDAFWPGGLTLVLRRNDRIAPAVSAGRDTVAVRLPSHPVALGLIRAAGVPVAAPSANRFMRTSATTARHVLDDLDGRVELILDGGPATVGLESTVVDVTTTPLRLLRPGAIALEDLERACGARLAIGAADHGLAASPGMMSRHYAPSKPLRLVPGDEQALVAAVEEEMARGRHVGVLCSDFEAASFHPVVRVERLGAGLEAIAHELFAAMRRLDAADVDIILVRDYGEVGLGRAIRDRLQRASTEE